MKQCLKLSSWLICVNKFLKANLWNGRCVTQLFCFAQLHTRKEFIYKTSYQSKPERKKEKQSDCLQKLA
jgi:hypothetical protein